MELYDKVDVVSKLYVDDSGDDDIDNDGYDLRNSTGISLDTVAITFQRPKAATYQVKLVVMKATTPKNKEYDCYVKVRLAKNETVFLKYFFRNLVVMYSNNLKHKY